MTVSLKINMIPSNDTFINTVKIYVSTNIKMTKHYEFVSLYVSVDILINKNSDMSENIVKILINPP